MKAASKSARCNREGGTIPAVHPAQLHGRARPGHLLRTSNHRRRSTSAASRLRQKRQRLGVQRDVAVAIVGC